MTDEDALALEITAGDQQILIKELRERIRRLEDGMCAILRHWEREEKGDCIAAVTWSEVKHSRMLVGHT